MLLSASLLLNAPSGLFHHYTTGMNVEVDEGAEERKGGAGHIGKMLLSAGDECQCTGCCCAVCWHFDGTQSTAYATMSQTDG